MTRKADATTASEADADIRQPDSLVWKVSAVAVIGPFLTQMDSTVVNVSLTAIRQNLHASLVSAQWIISGYLLALALMLPLNGWLVDRIGAKKLYLYCFSAFTITSLLCGAAHTMNQLIVIRVLQGMAGGLLAPMAQMMIARVAGRNMARVMGYTAMPILIAPILGPVLAGEILKRLDWPWLFYVNLPIGLCGVIFAAMLLPPDQDAAQKRSFDVLGYLLIAPGLVSLLYGLPRLQHGDGIAALLAGAALLVCYARYASHKGDAALIDLRLFKGRIFSASASVQFLSNGVMYARQFLVPLYLITACALSPDQTGRMLAALGVGMMFSFPMIGALTDRFGCRAVSGTGTLLTLLGMLPFVAMILTSFSPALAIVGLFVSGVGQGMINIPSISAAYASVSKERLPMANTALNIVQRLGGPLVTAALALVISASHADVSQAQPATHLAASPLSFMPAFILLIAIQAIASLSARRLPRSIHREDAPET